MFTFGGHPLAARFEGGAARLQQVARFFGELFDGIVGTTDLVVWGAILLGVTCGVLGCFIVLRRQSLLGDAIGHSVLPGVCLGFLVSGGRNTPALLLGALAFGLLAAALIGLLRRTTQLKTGECTGVVFTGFYGLGIVFLKFIQNPHNADHWLIRWGIFRPFNSGQAGLDKFLFGQIVGISPSDVLLMAAIAAVSITA